MPAFSDLKRLKKDDPLRRLAELNATTIRPDPDFAADVGSLVAVLSKMLDEAERQS